ncbi:coiled-coil alpha-helical rod protein 1 [Denticeps clupeoides]|uniref:Coiled-coil alpha-helical rod protein 1 n=1 Tax=Denticeps clupeoides TaxID=299321 RepID=A0AAY4AUY1_9TELE|nr:coiled-coil alpha-helical rod protein 1 [Denticeps clupeoides]
MERRGFREKLTAPSDFTSANVERESNLNLMPPSHFTASGSVPRSQPTPTASGPRFAARVMPTAPTLAVDPWLDIARAKQEILELREENQRLLEEREDAGSSAAQHRSYASRHKLPVDRGLLDSEWRLELDRLRAECERLRGQVETLRDNAARHREEMRDRESAVHRQNHEMQEVRTELCRVRTELGQKVSQLAQKCEESERLHAQQKEFDKERERFLRDLESSRICAQELEEQRLQAEEEARFELTQLQEKLEEAHGEYQTRTQQLSNGHSAEIDAVNQSNNELLSRLNDATQEVTSLKTHLHEVCTEKDEVHKQLIQLSQDFEAQAETVQSLRTYIGQLTPEHGLEERLNERVQRLEEEKEALQMSLELLNVRLTSVNDILAIQEKELSEEMACDCLLRDGSKGSRLLSQWRQKVFVLLVQLRSKDLQLRGEKNTLQTTISALREEMEREKSQLCVVQHSLQDREAQLDLQRLHTQALERDLTSLTEETERLREERQLSGKKMKDIIETVQRYAALFEGKVAEMELVPARLSSLGQRLTFAARRIDTTHGLLMRKEALWKVQQAAKTSENLSESKCIVDLQTEVALLSKDRDRLAQELKCTPELIRSALTDLQEKFDSEVGLLTEALSRTQEEAQVSETSRVGAELQRKQLEERCVQQEDLLVQLREEVLLKQDETEKALQEKVSECEIRCVKQVRAMESELNTARREHTKAVVALRQCERRAEREREQERAAHTLLTEQAQQEIAQLHKQLKEKDKERNLLLAVLHEQGLLSEYKRMRRSALSTSQALEEPPEKSTQSHDHLLSVLGDLQTLSAALINSSDEEVEESDISDQQAAEPS